MTAVLDRLRRDLAPKIAEALEALTGAEAEVGKASATREAAQASVNEFEAFVRPIEARAHAQAAELAPLLRAERDGLQQALKVAKTHCAIAAKTLTTAEAALADLRLAESQIGAGQSRGDGGSPTTPSAPHQARHMLLRKKGARAAIFSEGLAHARQ